MTAIIFKPAKTAMQSGQAKTHSWVLEYAPEERKTVDNLMGWQGSSDMDQEIRMFFESKESAISFAQKNEIEFEVIEPNKRELKLQAYADNFIA